MKEIALVLAGGFCSALGGVIAIWYQAKKARKIRMEEVRGEQQLEACKKALSLIGQIQNRNFQGTEKDVLNLMYDNGEWFSMNQVLLPHTFVENWKTIRIELMSIHRLDNSRENSTDDSKQEYKIDEISNSKQFIRRLIEKADEVLRKELGLKKVNIKKPEIENG